MTTREDWAHDIVLQILSNNDNQVTEYINSSAMLIEDVEAVRGMVEQLVSELIEMTHNYCWE